METPLARIARALVVRRCPVCDVEVTKLTAVPVGTYLCCSEEHADEWWGAQQL